MDRKPKTIYQLESPFTSVSWYVQSNCPDMQKLILTLTQFRPETSPENQQTILDLLYRYILSYSITSYKPLFERKD